MVQFVSIQCPKCGANLSVDEGHNQWFCSYCGTKILLDEDAKIREIELQREMWLKELEQEERSRVAFEKAKRIKIKATLILGLLGILLLGIGLTGNILTGDPTNPLFGLAFVGLLILLGIGFIWFLPAKK